jgi:hypothetical protein
MLGTVEFEVDDVLAQRLMDNELSDDEDVNDDDEASEGGSHASSLGADSSSKDPLSNIPKLVNAPEWQYTEELEENGIISVYEEVGSLAKYIFALRKEVQAVDAGIQETNSRLAALGPKVCYRIILIVSGYLIFSTCGGVGYCCAYCQRRCQECHFGRK